MELITSCNGRNIRSWFLADDEELESVEDFGYTMGGIVASSVSEIARRMSLRDLETQRKWAVGMVELAGIIIREYYKDMLKQSKQVPDTEE